MRVLRVRDPNDPRYTKLVEIYKNQLPPQERSSDKRLEYLVRHGDEHAYVLETPTIPSGVVAFALVRPLLKPGESQATAETPITRSGYALLDYLGTHRDAEGRGFGSFFMRELMKELRRNYGVHTIVIEVDPPHAFDQLDEEAAKREKEINTRRRRVNFYERLGAWSLPDYSYSTPNRQAKDPLSDRCRMMLMLLPTEPPKQSANHATVEHMHTAEIDQIANAIFLQNQSPGPFVGNPRGEYPCVVGDWRWPNATEIGLSRVYQQNISPQKPLVHKYQKYLSSGPGRSVKTELDRLKYLQRHVPS
ncbi:MAG: GNAT family N-acetyltransferase [Myxococcota bacterium]